MINSAKDRAHGGNNPMVFLLGLIAMMGLSLSSSFAQTTETFTSSTTWIAPAGVTSVQVECWGAGGAGGSNSTTADGGGGGGGGAYSMTASIAVVPGNSYTITVGVGGVAVSGGIGGDGGDTWFISTSTIFAQGGSGGNPPVGGAGGIGGTGGAAGSGIGDTRFSGGTGGTGRDRNQGQGGPGASSAGSSADGWSGPVTWSTVVASDGPTGSGAGGNGGGIGVNGFSGNIPGGAGGGSGESATGGNGANGQVILTYTAASDNCPESTSVTPSGAQTVCQGDAASALTANVTLSGGSGTPTIQYQWYYNTTNSNTVSGATLLAGATSSTYIPLTTASELGDRWYFCVGYATDNGCGQTNADQTLASNAVQVTVITSPATPGSISGTADVSPSTSGLAYSISAVPDATSYTWTVPTGWTINSGQGTTSISVTSGTEGQNGDISVTASNACGTSAASTLPVTVTAGSPPPTITLGANPSVCQGTTTANLPYSATTESPDQYSIDYSVDAEAEGFVDVVNASLPASPIVLNVPGGAAGGIYTGDLTVRNSGTGLSSGNYPISVTVNTAPSTPGTIFGDASVPPETSGLMYGIVDVPTATSYTWTVPSGWTITSGQGTTGIVVTSGTLGQNGNITVTASNACGTSAASVLAVTSEESLDHSLYGCNACHITHDALGGSLTNTLGNANLCMSCHVTSGAASSSPFSNADKAIPGTSGTSHAWDVQSVNATYETVLTTDPDMVLRVDVGNITCSTCHDQHNSNTNPSYTRISNAGDAMCKDCHSPRNVGRYLDNTIDNRGSHPVGLAYPGTDGYAATPTGSVIVVGGNVECSSCHQTHYANTTDGYLLRQTNDNALCTSCHTLFSGGGTPVGTHNGMSCKDCHQTHNTDKSNIYMIKNTITTPSSGDRSVIFTTQTGTNSFADGDGTYDGICEVCHTTTIHFRNDGSGSDQNHVSSGGPYNGDNCMGCHPHNANFAPQGCTDCHVSNYPGWGTTDNHSTHAVRYNYSCSTCHLNYGSGGSLEGTHPSGGSANISFDPSGMATRNGQDAITPVYNGDLTCDNMYCHSDGRSANRGQDGTYTWSGTIGPQTAVYATTPPWTSTGSITTCMPCHSGTGNMTDPYTITTPGLSSVLPPSTGSHRRGAHMSNSQELSGNGWTVVNCFWCHNTADGDDGSPILQGTYGTSFHVDGATFFDPRSFVDGGTNVNSDTGGSFSYSALGSAAHCGTGRSCW